MSGQKFMRQGICVGNFKLDLKTVFAAESEILCEGLDCTK